jgi:HEAT repeat protein
MKSRLLNNQAFTVLLLLAGTLVLLPAAAAPAQLPSLVNADIVTKAVPRALEAEFQRLTREVGPVWIGYSIDLVEGNHRIGCRSTADQHLPGVMRRSRCRLEDRDQGLNFQTDAEVGASAAATHLLVLYRVSQQQLERIRIFTDDCELDAGGLTVHWLTDVDAKESVDLLNGYAGKASEKAAEKRLRETALAALALHADPAADDALERLARPSSPEQVRKDAAFWMGNLRGVRGYKVLLRMLREDPSVQVREHCIFCLHVSKVPEALDAIIQVARSQDDRHLRGQALFWLSQAAGQKATQAIRDAIDEDPEIDIKKKAVFALSQLPSDEGIPKLIEVARHHRHPEVRKDAMFWLGQSGDERAVRFFEEVLRSSASAASR